MGKKLLQEVGRDAYRQPKQSDIGEGGRENKRHTGEASVREERTHVSRTGFPIRLKSNEVEIGQERH